jgi:Ca2+-binding RTX toxin-like protein
VTASGLTGNASFSNVAGNVGVTSITGTANGNDVIFGSATTGTTITAGNGSDNITGGTAGDSITAGNGNDTITGGGGNDTITAGGGNDSITGGTAGDSITSGNGNDTISGGGGNDTITVGAGNNLITEILPGTFSITTGAGTNTVDLSAALIAGDTVTAGSGNNTLILGATTATAAAGAHVSGFKLLSTSQSQNLANFAANTTFTEVDVSLPATITNAGALVTTLGLSGLIFGGNVGFATAAGGTTGSLTVNALSGGYSGDTNVGTFTANNDATLTFNTGPAAVPPALTPLTIATLADTALTTLNVQGGNDFTITNPVASTTLTTVNAGSNTGTVSVDLTGSTKNLTITGSSTADSTLTGGLGNDSISAGDGNDSITAGNGNDTITAGNGNNTIVAGTGNDSITVGNGNNTIVAGSGNDTITGGSGGANELLLTAPENISGDTLTNIQTLATGGFAVTLTDAQYAAFGEANITGLGSVTITNSAATLAGIVGVHKYVLGDGGVTFTPGTSTGGLTVTGGAGNDNITAGTGSDSIVGGAGNDTITLGTGTAPDTYNFATTVVPGHGGAGTISEVLASVGTDTVLNFIHAQDQFGLSEAVLGPLGGAGDLATTQFATVAGTGTITAPTFDVTTAGGLVDDITGNDLYFVQAGAAFTSGTTTLAGLVSGGDALKIAHLSSLTGALANTDFNVST